MPKYLEPFQEDFDQLCAAVKIDAVVLMECRDAVTGNPRAAICVTLAGEDGLINIIPIAVMEPDLINKLLPPEVGADEHCAPEVR